MKQATLLPLIGIFIAGFTMAASAQETLPEVTVMARNYKYIKSLNNKDAAQPIRLLEAKAAAYDVKSSDFYEDEYDTYFISFYLPQGYILAVYDSSGTLLRTAEKFKNVALPQVVSKSVMERYPNWRISNDVYRVSYESVNGANIIYKLILNNGNKRLRVKTNEKGEFLD